MYDNSSMTADEIRISNDTSWQFGVGIFNATANSRVSTTTADGGTGNLYVGYGAHANGTLNIQDTAQVSVTSAAIIGNGGVANGQLNVSGSGKLTAAEVDVSIANSAAAALRQLNISGNGQVITAASGALTGNVNQGVTSTTVYTPGDINISDNGYLEVGGNHNNTYGTLTISSTTGNPQERVFGDFTLGALPASGTTTGTVVLGGNGTLKIGNTATGTGNLILVNGTLNTSMVSPAAGADGRVQLMGSSSAIVFNGGTISPTASTVSFMPTSIPAAYIAPGGAIFNTAGFNITVAKGLTDSPTLGGGGLTKQGSGILTLTGLNTYSGGTTVAGGILDFNTAASIPATGTINVNGGVLRFTSAAAIPPAGSITVNTGGTLEVNATDPYNSVSNWLASGKIVSTSSGAIALTADSAEAINMAGYANLSLGTTGSWSYAGALTPAGNTYNLGGGGGTLYIPIANTITGAAKILAVNGPGTVVLQSDNNYTGGTILNSGTLSYTNDASIGGAATPITFNGGILMVPAGTANDLGLHSPNVNWTTFNGGFDIPDGATFTVTQVIGGAGSLTKGGAGTLTLTNQSTYTGGTNVYYGILQLSGGSNRLPTGGSIVVTAGGTLNLGNGTQTTGGDVTIAGGNILTGTINKTGTNPYYAQSGSVSAILTGVGGLNKSTTGTLILTPPKRIPATRQLMPAHCNFPAPADCPPLGQLQFHKAVRGIWAAIHKVCPLPAPL